jgi:hypothetical protein
MPPNAPPVKLSKPQRELLVALASYPYGEGHINPVGMRTASVLKRHGLKFGAPVPAGSR